jgi:hypothetical protein
MLTSPKFGIGLMVLSPLVACCLGWEAVFPVAITSLLGGIVCFMGRGFCTQMHVGEVTAELVQDLVSADQHHRELVLACLSKTEGDWFLAELPRAEAELRQRYWKARKGARASASWRWRLRLATKTS